ncbi:hypothetical protein AVEN_135128-1 [Araneus ventricosus]|uniref:Uncharacterized protein n=1 Tax=Araneus ventricosus TaxID=182803 RepID=A0A4Y2HGG2_ARAVE|nr:hypothetical protein AVEN_135128-1 [Araneus ventricosus]
MITTLNQEIFLTNAKYKSRLIGLFTDKFNAIGISVKKAENYADVLVVKTALMISKTQHNSTVIVGEDIDLLIILIPSNLEIFLHKPGKGKMEQKIYSSSSLEGICKDILFLHAFSGYDGASAVFQKGKSAALKLLQKRLYIYILYKSFISVSHAKIAEKGMQFFLGLYGASRNETSLNDYRYLYFTKAVAKNKAVSLSTLPLTSTAAQEHLFRV